MKKNRWKLWLIIFVGFMFVWMTRGAYITYKVSVERAKSRAEFEMKKGEPPAAPDPDMDRQKSAKPYLPPEPVPVKEPVDVWDWVVKIGGGLAGLKTLLDIIDKFRKRAK